VNDDVKLSEEGSEEVREEQRTRPEMTPQRAEFLERVHEAHLHLGIPPRRPFRQLDPGMGEAVARRTILRRLVSGAWETWGDVADRVAEGNISLLWENAWLPDKKIEEKETLRAAIAKGTILMSGRHLQHGDENQRSRPMEVFTNCSTAATSSLLMLLLLSGSGVGRRYDDSLMLVDWSEQPRLMLVLDKKHPDYDLRFRDSATAAGIINTSKGDEWFTVPDSREGWAKAVELLEVMTYEKKRDTILVLDFSNVRPAGAPIKGMQSRPASGPVPFMEALDQVSALRGEKDMPLWEQAMRVDHALASCVQVGGARRAARIAVKDYRDAQIGHFIHIKEEGDLWSANNSVGVDEEFWRRVRKHHAFMTDGRVYGVKDAADSAEYIRCYKVFSEIMKASYTHGSGEPGFINLDQLSANLDGFDLYEQGEIAGSARYKLSDRIMPLMRAIYRVVDTMDYPMVVNPCSEIALIAGPAGGFCVIADVAPFHADTLEEAREAFLTTTRALIRVNRMDSVYRTETKRTNRIGVGFTGIFEFAWKFFGLGFRDLIDSTKSQEFWSWMKATSEAVKGQANSYAAELGMVKPHTVTTVKPAGTTSKLFGLTEGAHLPARIEYLRWVQFIKNDPLLDDYEQRGYPVIRDIPGEYYTSSSIVGFPTAPVLGRLDIPREKIVLAAEATMREQFTWLEMVEHYWIGEKQGNQVSYTLKFDKAVVSEQDFAARILAQQPYVRCCSVIASSDWKATKALYGYVPEEPISKEEYDALVSHISVREEEIELESLNCEGGACPL
jgi:hypothetical protein